MKSRFFVFTIMVLCSALVLSAAQAPPQVKKIPHFDFHSVQKMRPNGEYVISVWKDGRFEEAGRLACDKILREQALDLSPYLAGTDTAKIKIVEQGQGAAHIDSVFLGGNPPAAVEGRDACRILKKVSTKDNDVIDARDESFELDFAANSVDKTLRLAARIEGSKIGTAPFQFPTENLSTRISPHSKFYTYTLNTSAPPRGKVGSEEYLKTVGQRTAFFQVFAPTSSGHPAGTTYAWVSNDEKNLYVTLDFTPDNTCDGDKDYAQVTVNTGREVKEFRVSVPERKWGTAHFTYTDKVAYEHKVYDFIIPLSELGGAAACGQELGLAFSAYGTSVSEWLTPSLAFDPDHRRYLLVFDSAWEGDYDIWGIFLDMQGNIIQVAGEDAFLICDADNDQTFPDVAYDSASGRFLVVWQDIRNDPMCYDIYGQMVNSNGTLYGTNIVIATDYYCQYSPAVANDSNQHQFLVVWYQSSDIMGQLVGGEGNLIPRSLSTTRIQSAANGLSNFVISDALGEQRQPDVAFDGLGNEYLVVFESGAGVPILRSQALDAVPFYSTINGQFVQWDGVPLYEDTDVNFIISDPAYGAVNPAIANDNVHHRFLVAWADYPSDWTSALRAQSEGQAANPLEGSWTQRFRSLHSSQAALQSQATRHSYGIPRTQGMPGTQQGALLMDEQPFIYGQLVDTAGNLVYESRLLLSETEEDLPPWLELYENNPALAFDSFNQSYLLIYYVFWWDWDYDYGGVEVDVRLIDSAGEMASDYCYIDWWEYYYPAPGLSPTVAYNSICRNFMMAWPEPDFKDLYWDIYGPTECVFLPEVTTAPVTQITSNSATCGGTVTYDGETEVTARGVCWNTTGGPTTHDSLTTDGGGLGAFISHLTGLSPNTKYYVRAYATNSVGTAYGQERTFTTLRQFVVTFVAGPGGVVSGTLVQVVPEGGDCTPVEAIADTGACFINWTGTTGFVGSSANPLTVTNVRQDMTITANFGTLGLAVEKLEEKAWIVKRLYGKVVLSVDGLDPTVPIRYVLFRKQSGGEYRSIKEFNSSDLQNNAYTYEDKFLEADITYVYQVVAYNPSGLVIGRSQEITVR